MPSIVNGVRVFRYADSERGKFCRYNDRLGWEGIPDTADDLVWLDVRSRVRQNAYGFRGTAHPFGRTGRRRIAVLGDSFVWGFGVDDGDLFTDVLERDTGIEFVNLGVSGYGTDQEFLTWESKGSRWQPDEVWLLTTFFTDLDDIVLPLNYGYPKPVFAIADDGALVLSNVPVPRSGSPPPRTVEIDRQNWATPLRPLVDHSDLFCGLLALCMRWPAGSSFLERRHLVPAVRPGYDFEYPFYHEPREATVRSWRLFAKLLEALDAQVTASGARLTLVIVPSTTQVYPDVWRAFVARRPADEAAALDPELPNRMRRSIAAERGVRTIDLLPTLRAAGGRDRHLYFPLNYHWTPAGHRVVADALRRALVD